MQDPLHAAIQQHQLGRLQEAARSYQLILARNPNHPDALHLLGVVAHQLGQHIQATELIGRAIALRPAAPAYHANLAEVWRAMGRLDKALECCRTALRLQPDYPEASNNLGLALLQVGNVAEAVEHFRKALALRPQFAMAHNNLANALRTQGDEAAAIEHFRQAVQCQPDLAEAQSNLGQLLCEKQQLPEALEHCRRAVELRPTFPEAHSNLGNVLREMGRLDEAREHYTKALQLNPRIGMIYNNMAQLLQEEGKYDEAFAWYEQALARDPNTPRIHCNLGSALGEKSRYDEAVAQYELALRLDPRCAEAYNGMGFVLHEQGRDEEAKQKYEAAVQLKPDFAPAHCNLGGLLEELNDLERAEAEFRTALRHDPHLAGALAHLATMLRSKLPDEDLATLRTMLAEPDQLDGRRAVLNFGLAQALDARKEYAEAAQHLRDANALALKAWRKRDEEYSPERHAEFVSEMLATCTPAFFERVRGLGVASERPVFIVGLPRSGTTLVEQVLASHSQVHGAGELRFAREDFEFLPEAMKSSDPEMTCLARIDREAIQTVAQRHLDRLHGLNSTALRIVDKMPDNYMYVGMLAVLFPKARFIHCRRDLRDIAVSCWITNFRQIRWANDLDHIASRFHEYQRLMRHWEATLPLPLLHIDYEETVGDFESVARRLVAWCGLEWEPACLDYHQTKRPVRTASVTQVRQPIYTRSVARWKNYEPALGSFFERLVPDSSE
ncbi:MAG TPA: tetratricopeptide repeat protein [Gemmataceae bacterium]|nr:tetratricopeptide repeat protein [Gemmataceae bacterium]